MEHQQQFTCPIHPEIKQDKPGNCPKCGMNLISEKERMKKQLLTTALSCTLNV